MGFIKSIHTSSLSDSELLDLYLENRRQDDFAKLYLRYTDLVYGTCMKYLGDEEAAKDAVMNIYEELLEKVLRHQIQLFKSWLYMVAKNHCLMVLRKQKKMPLAEITDGIMQSEDFSHLENALNKETQLNKLEDCMKTLNNEQEMTVRMFYLESKCYNEICDTTGLDWKKVRSLIQNGRRNLKICIEKNG